LRIRQQSGGYRLAVWVGLMFRRVHFNFLLLVLALAPLPFGANRPLSWTFLAAAVALLTLTWPLVPWFDRYVPVVPVRRTLLPAALFCLAVAWASAQAMPGLPAAWYHPIWAQVADTLAIPGEGFVAVDPDTAMTGVMRLLCYGSVFWLAMQWSRSARRARRLLTVLAAASIAYALYGLWVYSTGAETILWFDKWAYKDSLTSTFVNRNSYATYAGLGLLCVVAEVSFRLQGRRPGWAPLLLHARRPTALYALGGVAVLLALVLSDSRAGLTSSLAGLVVLLTALWIIGRDRDRVGLALVASAVGLLLFAGIAVVLLMSDTLSTQGSDRAEVYALTLGLIAERPWLGYGLGSFTQVFATIRPMHFWAEWTQVHNTYLELALDLGVPAAACVVAAAVVLAGRCAVGVVVRTVDGIFPAVALAACCIVALHATVDFSAQIPAVTVTWMAILGMGVGQCRDVTRRRGRRSAELAEEGDADMSWRAQV
jgi:O-antigen ligase